MAFVDREDVISLMTDLYVSLIQTLRPDKRVPLPVPRFTHAEAMARFGSDKPDVRFGLEIADFSEIAAASAFQVFAGAVKDGGVRAGLRRPGPRRPSPAARSTTWSSAPNSTARADS